MSKNPFCSARYSYLYIRCVSFVLIHLDHSFLLIQFKVTVLQISNTISIQRMISNCVFHNIQLLFLFLAPALTSTLLIRLASTRYLQNTSKYVRRIQYCKATQTRIKTKKNISMQISHSHELFFLNIVYRIDQIR